jgi:hypothetical protein
VSYGISPTVFARLMAYFAGEEDIQKVILFGSRHGPLQFRH